MVEWNSVEKQVPCGGKKYQVIVAGGGPAGIGAAIASARTGASTLLLEARSFFGGIAATSLWMPINRLKLRGGTRGGVHQLLVSKLESYGADAYVEGKTTWTDGDGLHVHPEYLRRAVFELLEESGCDYRLYSPIVDAVVENGVLKQAIVQTKDGEARFEADVFIDCTGDGDLAYRAGAEVQIGREGDGATMPVTLGFSIANVDVDRLYAFYDQQDIDIGMKQYIARAEQEGMAVSPWYSFDRTSVPGLISVNNGGLKNAGNFNMLDAHDATMAERIGLQIAMDFVDFARKYQIPGLEHCHLDRTGAAVGVRETRRVMCDYVLTLEDAARGAIFDDVVARRYGAVDQAGMKEDKDYRSSMKSGYDFPYRALHARGLERLMVAGRCGSYTHLALAAGKSMGNMMAIGQAAGAAAAVSAQKGVTPRQLPYQDVKSALDALCVRL